MESIFVVLIFFVSTKSWPRETAQNKKRYRHIIFFIFRCLNNIIDFGFPPKYNTTLHNYDTCQCNKLYFPGLKTNWWGKKKLAYKASKDFDNVNPEIEGTKFIFLL